MRAYTLPLPEPVALTDHVPAGKTDTSHAAFHGQHDTGKRTADQARILDAITHAPDGMTCDEVCVALDMLVQTASGRCNDLFRAGLIRRTTKRPTRTGASAYVWVAVATQERIMEVAS